jgi:hypothetical protein
MLHIPRIWNSLSVAPLESICGRADDFGDDERSFPGGREFVHAVGLLDVPKDEVANIEGSFLNVVIIVATKMLVMTSLSHNGGESLFFEVVKVDAACLFGLSFLIELDPWSFEGDVSR